LLLISDLFKFHRVIGRVFWVQSGNYTGHFDKEMTPVPEQDSVVKLAVAIGVS